MQVDHQRRQHEAEPDQYQAQHQIPVGGRGWMIGQPFLSTSSHQKIEYVLPSKERNSFRRRRDYLHDEREVKRLRDYDVGHQSHLFSRLKNGF